MNARLQPSLAPLFVLLAFFPGLAAAFALHGYGFEGCAVTTLAFACSLVPIAFVWMIVEGCRPR